MVKPVSTKNTKSKVPVIPAIQEAEGGESLESGRWRLQWAEIVPLHFSLGDKEKKTKQNKKPIFISVPRTYGPLIEKMLQKVNFLKISSVINHMTQFYLWLYISKRNKIIYPYKNL